MSDTVIGYFLKNHKVASFGKLRKWKTLTPYVVLFNSLYLEDSHQGKDTSSLFLQLLFSWGRMTTFVSLLEGCRYNWTAANITDIAKIMIVKEDWDFLERLMDMSTVV